MSAGLAVALGYLVVPVTIGATWLAFVLYERMRSRP